MFSASSCYYRRHYHTTLKVKDEHGRDGTKKQNRLSYLVSSRKVQRHNSIAKEEEKKNSNGRCCSIHPFPHFSPLWVKVRHTIYTCRATSKSTSQSCVLAPVRICIKVGRSVRSTTGENLAALKAIDPPASALCTTTS